jgi:hypothetical protein
MPLRPHRVREPGHLQYWSAHWPGGKLAYPGSGTSGSGQNDEPWYENSTTGDCLVQTS